MDWDRLKTGVTLTAPEGEGPFPVAVLMHGCGGQRGFLEGYAQAAVDSGHAAILLDSWTPRGLSRQDALRLTCTGLIQRGPARARDIDLLLASLDDPRLDLSQVTLAGWSHGGWAIAEALTRDAPPAGVTGAFLFYPYCGWVAGWPDRPFPEHVRIAALIGEADTVSDYPACEQALDRPGVALTVYPGATHAFEDSDASDERFVYDAELAADAQARFKAFLSGSEN